MTTQAYALPRPKDIPEAAASETKLIGAEPHPPVASDSPDAPDADWPTLAVLSRRYVDRALAQTDGNKTRAADLLGIDRRTLNRIVARDRVRRPRPA